MYPATAGALHNVTPAYPNNDAFVTKILPGGGLGYSALIGNVSPQNGGGGPVGLVGIATDSGGNAYITGNAGTLWPTTAGAYQLTIPGTQPYAAPFVTKVSPDGSTLLYSTFLGPSNGAGSVAIVVDANQDVTIAGRYASTGFPTTSNAYEGVLQEGCCASFISRFDSTGSHLIYSSFFSGIGSGSYGTTSATGIALDASGDIWLTGTTNDPAFPLVHPVLSVPASGQETLPGFVSEFNPSGSSLLFRPMSVTRWRALNN